MPPLPSLPTGKGKAALVSAEDVAPEDLTVGAVAVPVTAPLEEDPALASKGAKESEGSEAKSAVPALAGAAALGAAAGAIAVAVPAAVLTGRNAPSTGGPLPLP